MCVYYLIYVGTIYLAVNEGRNMRNVAGVGREMREIGEGGRSALHTIKNKLAEKDMLFPRNTAYSTTQQFSTWEFNLRIETHPRKKVEYYSHAHLNEFVVIKEYAVFNPFPPHTAFLPHFVFTYSYLPQ